MAITVYECRELRACEAALIFEKIIKFSICQLLQKESPEFLLSKIYRLNIEMEINFKKHWQCKCSAPTWINFPEIVKPKFIIRKDKGITTECCKLISEMCIWYSELRGAACGWYGWIRCSQRKRKVETVNLIAQSTHQYWFLFSSCIAAYDFDRFLEMKLNRRKKNKTFITERNLFTLALIFPFSFSSNGI